MTDRDAFVRAILQNPAEDTTRLVFADWLGENGEPERAEFIRVQCALPRTLDEEIHPPTHREGVPGCTTCRRFDELRRRERELWGRNKCEWFGDRWAILTTDRDDVCNYTNLTTAVVRRGFVDEIRCPLAVFLEHAESLFRNHPITRVIITDWRPVEGFHSRTWGIFTRIDTSGRGADPKEFATEAEATESWSAACVAYGRERAGLPAL